MVNASHDINDSLSDLISLDASPKFMEEAFQEVANIISKALVVIGIFGILGNILTLVVYAKLGFSETIHMSYVALAVSDFGCLLTLLYMCFCFSYLLEAILLRYRMRTDITLFANFTGAWPHHGFTRTPAMLTAWVSFERCLCVIFPTRVKLMITRKVTKVVLAFIYVIGCCPVVLAFVGMQTEKVFDPETNFTTLILKYADQTQLNRANQIAFILYGAAYPLLSWVMVVVCATFLITALKRSVRWRSINSRASAGATGSGDAGSTKISPKETRVTRTVVIIACAFIFFSFPIAAIVVFALINREFSVNGELHFPLMISVAISFLFSGLNSSVNIVVYTITGSRFRSTLVHLFQPKLRKT